MGSGERIKTSKDLDGITVHIKTKKNWFMLFFLPVWLTGWTLGGIVAITSVVTRPDLFLVVWLCGWAVGEAWAICSFLWNAFGEEKISIQGGLFTHKREVFGRGLARVFPLHELINLRASGFFGDSSSGNPMAPWGLAGGTVAVDTRYGDTYKFGIHLEEKDAVALAKTLEPYVRRNI